ncbi:Protein-tyrosine sulfotransferase 1 [Clonorchis sinensis]|uniref:Protein-tyrosine sulfotransferase 1 n=2 Tax=Clonorchis sinensis TaxID=79923 RepID=A0A8T1MFA2_CLOSI|nr:Protein-tyrosine sulfotransferase 1 [Clonorchis sinensis]GAA51125.1 protein-tyrosine sulfotransferase [Clonorchis sinensis]
MSGSCHEIAQSSAIVRCPSTFLDEKQTLILLLLLVALTCFVLLKNSKTNYVCEEAAEDPPLIFISGQQSSGTGLMRIVLDAHPWINCGAEPIYPIRILNMRKQLEMTNRDWGIKANLYPVAIDRATKAYIRELAVNMVDPTRIYCQKQPLIFEYLDILAKLFPTAKFVHIVRDGRATVVSSLTRRIVRPLDPVQALRNWDDAVRTELHYCQNTDRQRCYTIFYEKLVISPEKELRKLLAFLEVPWDPIVLRHETILDKLSHLNPHEASTKQFSKPIHTASLGAWAYPNSTFTPQQLNASTQDAPLLKELGYDLAGPVVALKSKRLKRVHQSATARGINACFVSVCGVPQNPDPQVDVGTNEFL